MSLQFINVKATGFGLCSAKSLNTNLSVSKLTAKTKERIMKASIIAVLSVKLTEIVIELLDEQ